MICKFYFYIMSFHKMFHLQWVTSKVCIMLSFPLVLQLARRCHDARYAGGWGWGLGFPQQNLGII